MTCNHRAPREGEFVFTCPSCGEAVAGLPRDYAFRMPDYVFGLSAAQRQQCARQLGDDFWSTAPDHFYVRCLLPIPLFDGDEFCFGVWVELQEAEFRNVLEVWDDPVNYEMLEFDGTLANMLRIPGWSGYGVHVHLATRNAQSRPFVTHADDESLQNMLEAGWTQEVFEHFSRTLIDRV